VLYFAVLLRKLFLGENKLELRCTLISCERSCNRLPVRSDWLNDLPCDPRELEATEYNF